MHEILERLRRELADGIDGLAAEQTQGRREPGKWSIQQIAEHLVLSYGSTVGTFETRLAKGTPTKARPTLQQWIGQLGVTTFGYFPRGRTAPDRVCPAEPPLRQLSGGELAEAIGDGLARMDAVLTRAEESFGQSRRAISHMVLGPMNVRQWRRFHLVHGEHHLRQIQATRKTLGV